MLVESRSGSSFSFEMSVTHSASISIVLSSFRKLIEKKSAERIIIFIDPVVLSQNSSLLDLEYSKPNVCLIPVSVHEKTKTWDVTAEILKVMHESGVGRRNQLICAVGGGALMDVVSFAASIFRRGISVVKVPTTLLGMVDAAIGIKTGVNFLGQRNRVGSYHFDFDVIIDVDFLRGLSNGLVRQGLGEILKIATIKGPQLFQRLKENSTYLENSEFYQSNDGVNVIIDSIFLMLEELHENPRETNLRRCVDFGHSFTPLAEMASVATFGSRAIPHGYAVAYDCLLTSMISRQRRLLNTDEFNQIFDLYQQYDFDFANPLFGNNELLWASLLEFTKHRGGSQNLPVPIAIGKYDFLQDITFEEIEYNNTNLRKMLKI